MPERFEVLDEPFFTPGPLLAQGRAADVFEYDDGLVLRRYRTDHDCVYEAAVMQHVRSHGYPAPEVIAVAGRDLVMERIDGPTMLRDVGKRPWRLYRHAATLAGLQQGLHDIPPPGWLHTKHEGGTAIVHLDLHPDNVMLSPSGPIVIDWSNAGLGDPDIEVADLWLVMSSATVPGSRLDRLIANAGRGLFVNAILRHFDRAPICAKLAAAHQGRSRDRNMSEAELERMNDLVERFGTARFCGT
jgi:tRNA A-37 threonylcarbamoyl transferase component Bud32